MITIDWDKYSFDILMQQCLAEVPEELDKRQNSIIYRALAPACMRVTELYILLQTLMLEMDVATASGENLDNLGNEFGVTRNEGIAPYVYCWFRKADGSNIDVNKDPYWENIFANWHNGDGAPTTWAGPEHEVLGDIVWTCTEPYDRNNTSIGIYKLVANVKETLTDKYLDNSVFTQLSNFPGIYNGTVEGEVVMKDTYAPFWGKDEESDEEFRKRIQLFMKLNAFGGNRDDYILKTTGLTTTTDTAHKRVAAVQPFATPGGIGGRVHLAVLGEDVLTGLKTNFTAEELAQLKQKIDPYTVWSPDASTTGEGFGFAPIGHQVSISNVKFAMINIRIKRTLLTQMTGEPISETQWGEVISAIKNYADSVSTDWGVIDGSYQVLTFYYSDLVGAITNIKDSSGNKMIIFIDAADAIQMQRETDDQPGVFTPWSNDDLVFGSTFEHQSMPGEVNVIDWV